MPIDNMAPSCLATTTTTTTTFTEKNVARRVFDTLRQEMGSQVPPFRNNPPPPPPHPQQDANTGAQANATPRGAVPPAQAQAAATTQQDAPQGTCHRSQHSFAAIRSTSPFG